MRRERPRIRRVERSERALVRADGQSTVLPRVARRSIGHGVERGSPWPADPAGYAEPLRQAIMDHLRSLPVKRKGELPVIPVDDRAAEVRAIKVG